MFAEYLQAAMDHAVYEQFEDGTYFGSIPGFQGVYANEATLEATRKELLSVLEDWVLMGIADHEELPEVDGHSLLQVHEFMKREHVRVSIPNPHRGEISKENLLRILKEAGISREEWEAL